MDVIERNADWFASDEGISTFQTLTDKGDRTIFLYSYLKAATDCSVKTCKHLIRVAFFLEDAIATSALPYAAYPALIDRKQNPFVAYITQITAAPSAKDLLCVFLSILHCICDPLTHTGTMDSLAYSDKFYADKDLPMLRLDPDLFEIEEELRMIQLESLWLFGREDS